jgi:hypothetical protein
MSSAEAYMKRMGWMLAGFGVVLAVLAANRLLAQQAVHPSTRSTTVSPSAGPAVPGAADVAGGKGEKNVRIKHMPKLGKACKERTPEYTNSASHGVKRQKEWGVFDVTYETAPEWVDELVFTIYLMTEHRTLAGKKEYNTFQATIRSVDIQHGEHMAGVVLQPAGLLRFGEPVAVGVEIANPDGTVLAADSTSSLTGLPSDWWKNPKMADVQAVVKHDGYLVDRAKSPFALVDLDDFEVTK